MQIHIPLYFEPVNRWRESHSGRGADQLRGIEWLLLRHTAQITTYRIHTLVVTHFYEAWSTTERIVVSLWLIINTLNDHSTVDLYDKISSHACFIKNCTTDLFVIISNDNITYNAHHILNLPLW